MNVYIANFGSGNWAWPECQRRHAIAVMDDMRVHPFWQRGDREGYIETAMRVLRTRKGQQPTRSVAARWYSVNALLHETAGDFWIHREKDQLWWTVSTDEQPEGLVMDDPDISSAKVEIAVYYKRCEPWSQHDKAGRTLLWAGIHPKACEFLFTEGTFQQLSVDNALYAQALINGNDLTSWHQRSDWRAKEERSGKGAAKVFNPLELTAARMAQTALDTAAQSGQISEAQKKDKKFLFERRRELEIYATELIRGQEGLCALTGLEMLLDGMDGDPELRCSLDRINSSGHYERGNLQVVCKFANRWKSASDNGEFKRLISLLSRRA
jgi:hypothetical protein